MVTRHAAVLIALCATVTPGFAAQSANFVACSKATFRYDPTAMYHLDLLFEEVSAGPNALNLIVEEGLAVPELSGTAVPGGWSLQLRVAPYQQEAMYRSLNGTSSVQVSITFDQAATGLDLQFFAIGEQSKNEC